MSKVYFLKVKEKSPQILTKAGEKILKTFTDFFNSKDKLAIKLHFGERESKTYLNPVLVEAIYNGLKEKVKEVVLTDSTVLYKSDRSFASSHKKLAIDHGFGFAPILIADGEKGNEDIKIEINKKHFKEVKIGAGIKDFNSILTITHFTGHIMTGFGGALKNVGMGLGSKGGKLEMHQHFNLKVNTEICQGCGNCQKECPVDAISIKDGKAQINHQKCIGCGLCVSICPYGAVERPMKNFSSRDLQERIVEYTFGVLKNRKNFFINVLLDITPMCDCCKGIQEPMIPDIGILASEDIVAVEQASLDLIGKEKFQKPEIDSTVQIDYAQKLGLGEKKYKLVEIE